MTTFNVERFKTALTAGGSRPNQFMVQLSFPAFVTSQAVAVARAPFLVHATELPGQSIAPATVMYRGREVPFSGDRIFSPWTVSIYNDHEMSLRTAMEQWTNGMEDLRNKQGKIRPAEYQRDLDVYQLDRNGVITKAYKMVDAFPIDISPVSLGFDQNDQISTFMTTFRYLHFEASNNPLGGLFNIGNIFNR